MSVNDLLSQDEIDALLNGVDLGDLVPEAGPGPGSGGVQPYDFFSQDRVVQGRMPALDTMNEKLARDLCASMLEQFCTGIEVFAADVQVLKYSEFAQDLRVPASVHLVALQPLPGTALIVLDSTLVFRTVESFFGGDGRQSMRYEAREFAPMEQRIITPLVAQILARLESAWLPVVHIESELIGTESGPGFENLFNGAEAMVVSAFEVRFPAGSGELRIAMPYAMIEPVLDQLGASITDDRSRDCDAWRGAMMQRIRNAKITVSSAIAEGRITLRQLARLQPGDVISAEITDPVCLQVEGKPMFWGEFGIHGEKNAVKVGGICREESANSTGEPDE